MKKTIKKFRSVALAALMVATMSVGMTANASRESYGFYLNTSGASAWSDGNEKDDNEQIAYIYTTGGSVSATSYAYFTLYKDKSATSANQISNSKKITSNSDKYTIPYTTERGTGSISYIYATAGYYATSASGYWWS